MKRRTTFTLAGLGLCLLIGRGALAAAEDQTAKLTFQEDANGYAGTRAAVLLTSNLDRPARQAREKMSAALISYHTLLRFDGVAEAIHSRLAEGYRIDKATVTLHWHSTVSASRPWHVKANLLRRPWWPDGRFGPSWLGNVAGLEWWAGQGASDDEQDQFGQAIDSVLLDDKNPVGELDVTAALTDAKYGKTAGERLRQFEQDHGVDLSDYVKLES